MVDACPEASPNLPESLVAALVQLSCCYRILPVRIMASMLRSGISDGYISFCRAIMREEQTRLQSEIVEWEEDWKKDHDGKLPNEDGKYVALFNQAYILSAKERGILCSFLSLYIYIYICCIYTDSHGHKHTHKHTICPY